MHLGRRLATGAAAVILAMTAAGPASAHTQVNTDRHLRSVVVSAPPGLDVTVADDGSAITLTTTRQVSVEGYQGERFLTLGAGPTTQDTSLTWSDHRTSWHGSDLPQDVVDAPDEDHVVGAWSIPVTVDGTPAEIAGEIRWVAVRDSVALTVTACLGVLAVGLALALRMAFPSRRSEPDDPPGDHEVDLVAPGGQPLVDQAEQVAEEPT
ncbi:hypothetical protein ABLE68_20905 [Nocardioides sp. CN2-186]|uniref:hypothetical protein n=1 Tax=Nocardioides tweenelious TaxID=3156607 RepID=UPI0032B391AA